MTVYRPCYGCATDPHKCSVRAKMKAQVKGLHLTSINFSCQERIPIFSPGERVSVEWEFSSEECGFHGEDPEDVKFAATIIKEKRYGRYTLRVDPGESITGAGIGSDNLNLKGFATASINRLKALGEPGMRVCGVCHAVVGISNMDEECFSSGYTKQTGCIAED